VSDPRCQPVVTLVHGLWFGPWSLKLLARRLRKAGFETRMFSYRSTRGSLDEHARSLRQFIADHDVATTHLVAHSLGGLVTLTMLASNLVVPAGRVVLLGSPLRGSAAARKSAGWPGGKKLLGAARAALEDGLARPVVDRDVGVIAGSRQVGLGLLLGGIGGPGDGTVAIAETRMSGLRDHRVLPVTHTGMLFSSKVAGEVARFLRSGSFSRSP
jgi:pimeloyl-ACP methyl ester carboxylesterase